MQAPVRSPSSNRNLMEVSTGKLAANVAPFLSVKSMPSLSKRIFENRYSSFRESRASCVAGPHTKPDPKRLRSPDVRAAASSQAALPENQQECPCGPANREYLRRVRPNPSASRHHRRG